MGVIVVRPENLIVRLHLAGVLGFALVLLVIGYLFSLALGGWSKEFELSIIRDHDRMAVSQVKDGIRAETRALEVVLDALLADARIEAPLRQGDAEALDALTRPTFQRLRDGGRVSHIYFISLDRKVVRRLHKPHVFGDVISRLSMKDAEATQRTSSGFDLGIDGALRLRVVAPWRTASGEIVGYVEVAAEAPEVLARSVAPGVPVTVLVSKAQVSRPRWEAERLAGGPDWDALKDQLVVSAGPVRPELLDIIRRDALVEGVPTSMSIGDRFVAFSCLSLADARGGSIASVIITTDLTAVHWRSRTTLRLFILVMVGGGAVLLGLTHFGMKAVERMLLRSEKLRQDIEHAANHDGLTGVLTRAEFDRRLASFVGRAAHGGEAPLGLMLLDIDHFKKVNDTYGHPAGDAVLKAFAMVVSGHLRPGDHFARYGGEEFAILLPGCDEATVAGLAARILRVVAALRIPVGDTDINVTVSIGTVVADGLATPDDLVAAADAALYRAKQEGRDRVCAARPLLAIV